MRDYIIRRLLLMIPTVFLITIIVFFLVRFIPGDVIDVMVADLAKELSTQEVEISAKLLREQLGLDEPVHVQYARWLGVAPKPKVGFDGVFQASLGTSLWSGLPVSQVIAERIPVSFQLGLMAFIIKLLIALPVGIYSAIRQDTGLDYTGRTIAILMISMPSFWLGTMVIVYPSIWWQWMPPLEYTYIYQNPIENLKQTLIPAFILGMVAAGTTMRMTRTMMLEVLRQDYIRTAWSKGLAERTIIVRHALKNAMIPVITIIGMQIPLLISGSVVLEQIFGLPGVGRLMIQALTQRDYPIISGINLVLALVILTANLLVDLTYAWLDPRVHYK